MVSQNAASYFPCCLVCMNISTSPGLSRLTIRNANLLILPYHVVLWQLRLYFFPLI